jgi:hypothetical protein
MAGPRCARFIDENPDAGHGDGVFRFLHPVRRLDAVQRHFFFRTMLLPVRASEPLIYP